MGTGSQTDAESVNPSKVDNSADTDELTRRILDVRARRRIDLARAWLVRRALMTADSVGLLSAFLIAEGLFGRDPEGGNPVSMRSEVILFVITIPVWLLMAGAMGLYRADDERTNHSTADEVAKVFHLVTTGLWAFTVLSWSTGWANLNAPKLVSFWVVAIACVLLARLVARAVCRRSLLYQQNTLLIGAGPTATRIARKIGAHSEYGLNVLGFLRISEVDSRAAPKVLGGLEDMAEIQERLKVDRVMVACEPAEVDRASRGIRTLRGVVHVDVLPTLSGVLGPAVGVHTIEGIPFVGLPALRASSAARHVKRLIDVFVAVAVLTITAPLFIYLWWRIPRETPGPVFFRQERLGERGRRFQMYKFRSMVVGDHDSEHREHVQRLLGGDTSAAPSEGIYKLDRGDLVTPSGAWLRRTSLDELPQLINVLRGDMALVGPRPCLAYEVERFEPEHFDRFEVPAGITGLWQVAARAHASPQEALEMDCAYARNWSLGLDLRLILRTPLALLRQRLRTN